MLPRKTSIATFVIVILVAVATLLLGVWGVLNYVSESRNLHARLADQADSMTSQVAAGLVLPLWNFDRDQVDKIIESAMQVPEVYGVVVRQVDASAPNGTAFHVRVRNSDWGVIKSDHEFAADGLVVREMPITVSGESIGVVKLYFTARFVESSLRRELVSLGIRIVAMDLILIFSLYVVLRRMILLPLGAVERYAFQVSSGGPHDLGRHAGRAFGEIESLRSSVEKMINMLDERYAALQKSETMLSCILNSVPQSIFWKDVNGVYLGGNDTFAKAAGAEHPNQLLGKTDFDLPWPREDAEAYRRDDKQVVESATAKTHIIETLRQADGTALWVDTTKVPLFDAAGKVYGVLGVYEDITERKRAEEALRFNQEQFRLLFDQSIVGIIICEVICDFTGAPSDFRLIKANPAFNALTGLKREDQIGKDSEALGWKWPDEIKLRMLELAYSGGHFRYERFNESLGRHYEVQAFSPMSGQFALIFNDVTERKRAEALLLESEKMRTVAGLAAGMAHEINNPLAGMLQNAQVVLNRVSPDLPANRLAAEQSGTSLEAINAYLSRRGIPEMLQNIRSSGQRAAEIVANMLSFSRKNESQMESHVLASVLDRTLELAASDYDLKKQYDFKSIEVIREYAAQLPEIPCRASELQQVVLNLLKNAVQAMAERSNGDAPRITLRTKHVGASVRIEVEDNGPGMPPAVARRVFEPFFTTKEPHAGSGLGLFVSYFIITQNHHGAIAVESTEGRGTKFTITLPLTQDQ